MKVDPGYTEADGRRDETEDRTQLIKVRAMAEALKRELHHPMNTHIGNLAMKDCRIAFHDAVEETLVDVLNPTISELEG